VPASPKSSTDATQLMLPITSTGCRGGGEGEEC
jgi:hypothetical protein